MKKKTSQPRKSYGRCKACGQPIYTKPKARLALSKGEILGAIVVGGGLLISIIALFVS